MSVWYSIKSQKQLDNLIKKLEKCGYNNSDFGCPKEDCIAIALYNGDAFDKNYTFLNALMCTDDPYYSWTRNRTEVSSEKQFINYIENF